MPFQIVRNDISKMKVDAIVNAANPTLLGGGGVDGAIHRAAGAQLLEECRSLGGCRVGEAKLTGAYNLPCKYVIHTVGPQWRGGLLGEKAQLAACYRAALELALENGCETVAFPLISAGKYGFPRDKAMKLAVDTIGAFLLEHEMTVYLTVFGRDSVTLGRRLFADIREYIDDNYVKAQRELNAPRRGFASSGTWNRGARFRAAESIPMPACSPPPQEEGNIDDLDSLLRRLDESFQQMLLRKIDESGMTDAQCYKKANIDRRLFSKIRNDVNYKPSKATVIAFGVALELPLDELKDMLMKAGFSLSRSSKFDIIVEYFIKKQNYNVYEINEALFAFDQGLLGSM